MRERNGGSSNYRLIQRVTESLANTGYPSQTLCTSLASTGHPVLIVVVGSGNSGSIDMLKDPRLARLQAMRMRTTSMEQIRGKLPGELSMGSYDAGAEGGSTSTINDPLHYLIICHNLHQTDTRPSPHTNATKQHPHNSIHTPPSAVKV